MPPVHGRRRIGLEDGSSVKLGKHAWAMIPNGAAYKATHTEKTRLFFAF